MNAGEAKNIYRTLFVAFPGYRNWLEKTETAEETFSVWCKMLSNVPHGAGVAAADLMVSGDRKMPEAYERDQLPLYLKSYALRIAQDEQKRRATEGHRNSRLRASDARTGDEYALPLSKGLRMMQELGRKLRDGEIDQDTHDGEFRRIKQLAMEKRAVTS